MSHEDIVAKIQRMAREKYEKEHNESVTAAVKLKAEKDAEIEKEKKRKELKQAIEDDFVPFEYAETNPKYYPTPHGYIGEFIVETKVMPDRRIRFSAPPEIKKKLKAGQKVKLEVRLLSD